MWLDEIIILLLAVGCGRARRHHQNASIASLSIFNRHIIGCSWCPSLLVGDSRGGRYLRSCMQNVTRHFFSIELHLWGVLQGILAFLPSFLPSADNVTPSCRSRSRYEHVVVASDCF